MSLFSYTFPWYVIDGPDEPTLEVHPIQSFYLAGDSLNLSCQANGFPQPVAEWVFGGKIISQKGVLNLANVQTSQGGVYTCRLVNEDTKESRQKNMNLTVYGMWKSRHYIF